ncbi:MAG TPA: aminomethyltransferase family protein [Blastocatellia bacterium]|nr:aminomethyltransferase family protein [Blastocatellia bacterium]
MITPLADLHRRAGAALEEFGGWTIPSVFTDLIEEYNAVRQRVGLLDLSCRGRIQVSGKERVRYLQSLLSNDVARLAPGSGCVATLLTNKGRMISFLRVLNMGESFLLDVEPAAMPKTFDTLMGYRLSLRVQIEDVTAATAVLSLQGQYAWVVIRALAASELDPLDRELDHREILIAVESAEAPNAPRLIPVRLVRASHTGEEGYDLIAGVSFAPLLWQMILQRGEDYGLKRVGWSALNLLRVEAAIPWYGVDLDETTIPLEAGLDNAVSFGKGCYVGQETIVKIAHRGHVNRRLVGLVVKGESVPEAGARIFVGGSDVGRMTSAVFSPMLASVIALGYVKRELSSPGTAVTIRTSRGDVEAEIVPLPFLSPPGAG